MEMSRINLTLHKATNNWVMKGLFDQHQLFDDRGALSVDPPLKRSFFTSLQSGWVASQMNTCCLAASAPTEGPRSFNLMPPVLLLYADVSTS